MPSTLTYPGVYIEEIPSGVRTISGVATSITAFVGYTSRGPLNQPVRIFNFGDYEREFGGLHRDSDVSYAVQQFFMNGGGDAYVVRLAGGAAAADVELRWGAGGVALEAEAVTAGAWGNDLRLEVNYDAANPYSQFNLVVRRVNPATGEVLEQEEHRNLSMNSRSGSYAPSVVTAASRLIKLRRPGALGLTENLHRGYSRTRLMNGTSVSWPANSRLRLLLNGSREVELVLAALAPTPPASTATQVRNRINTAIGNVPGLSTDLQAERADVDGEANTATGSYVRLVSLTGDAEFSSVVVLPASANDVAPVLGLGRALNGWEKEGASYHRPLASGTRGASLTDLLGTSVNGTFTVTLTQATPSGSEVLLPTTAAITLPATPVGPALRDALQALIRGIVHPVGGPIAQKVTVTLGPDDALHLRLPDAYANVIIEVNDTGLQQLRLPNATPPSNLQRYSLGSQVTASGQSGGTAGFDGNPPLGTEYLGSFSQKTGIYALRDVDLFNLLCLPGLYRLLPAEHLLVAQTAVAFCEQERAFAILEAPPSATLTDVDDWAASLGKSRNAAVYFSWIRAADPKDGFRLRDMPPSGAIAGVYARTDATRGVWKAPAGTEATLNGTQALSLVLTDMENGTLNPLGVNVLRNFPVYGRVIWGARTRAGADENTDEYKYVPVRRLALYIEETLYRNTQWVVFEPNDEPLWSQIRLNVGAFMNGLFRQGAFQGNTPARAYLVKCDSETTTQYDIDRGIVNILVAFAPLKPAEFVVIQIQQKAQIPS